MSEALLALEDGTTFLGRSLGAGGETFGEVVFNTGMSGYQEVLTDPSYARQIVVMTYPHQGNYGVNRDDPESGGVCVAGFVVREAARRASSWRAERALGDYLADSGVVAIEDIDTRALTLHIREAGAMRAGISTEDLEPPSLVERVRAQPGMAGADLARTVSTERPYTEEPGRGDGRFRVAALDWGLKRNSLRLLARSGCRTTVFPALTDPEEVLRGGFDGVFLSNGPGDPAATGYAVEAARRFLGRIPVFGICLGHQVLARALGGRTYKLPFGHRGANQPVLDLATGRVAVTSHNHGFAVDPDGFPGPALGGAFGSRPATIARAPRPTPQPPRSRSSPAHRLSAAAAHGGGSLGSAAHGRGGALGSAARGGGGDPATATAADPSVPVVDTGFGRVALTHWNLNDGVLEGLRCLEVPAFSVQYHPEAAPGPHDSAELFDRFAEVMEAAR